jgi:hypothetical protein
MSSEPPPPVELNLPELRRYLRRVADRWLLTGAHLGGARLADARGARPQRERGPEYLLVLVSEHFDGVPWLERVHQCASLWDSREMRGAAEVHCYTPPELARKVEQLPRVRDAVAGGLDLLLTE